MHSFWVLAISAQLQAILVPPVLFLCQSEAWCSRTGQLKVCTIMRHGGYGVHEAKTLSKIHEYCAQMPKFPRARDPNDS